MKTTIWVPILLSCAVLAGISGCGNSSGTAVAANTTAGQVANHSSAGQGQRGSFQPNILMTTNPTTPTAATPFTLEFSMQRPNLAGGNGRPNSGGGGFGGQGQRPFAGGGGGNGGQGGGGAPTPPSMSVEITGNGVNQTVQLNSQNRTFEGNVTLGKAGSYQVKLSMNFGPRQQTKDFTLQVK